MIYDYCVSHVIYSMNKPNQINGIMVHVIINGNVKTGKMMTRDGFVQILKSGKTVITLVDSTISKGIRIHLINREDKNYISTDPNEGKRDNLDNLFSTKI